ncbi:MAG: DUF1841 family protein [Nitrospirae bacterium]|nr:DUF1841 family protein [Nitrospirota bacterium]
MSLFDKSHQVKFTRVAAARQEDAILEGEDDIIARMMDLHPEFDLFWPMGEYAAQPQEVNGTVVNPYVHTALHVIVEKQIENLAPPETFTALQSLQTTGQSRHDALHRILSIYAEIYFYNFRKGLTFDELSYVELLRDLK